jgi:hypothetical protein
VSRPIEESDRSTEPSSAIAVRTLKRQKLDHIAPNEMLLSTVAHWLEARWVSPASLLRVVETFCEDSTEDKTEADDENLGEIDTSMEEGDSGGIGGIGGIPTEYLTNVRR